MKQSVGNPVFIVSLLLETQLQGKPRWSQLALIRTGMRAFHGPLRVLQKARSFTFLAKIRAKWERVHLGK
uniref:Uncharacterized protein n=1 Tax=Lotus japonicus TaxID=34305 RepID=I3T0U0_LOTJA|nr:unknown [Lotus japonicus]